MTDYRAIDAEELRKELDGLTDVLEAADLSDDEAAAIDGHISRINHLIHRFNQPIIIDDRPESYQVTLEKP